VATVGVAILYFCILTLLRKAHSKIVKHFYDYKYEFVKVFNESIEGAQLIKIYGVGRELIEKAKKKYINFASYKLASNYISYGQNILCDLTSTVITAFALELGTNVKMAKKTDIAVLATSILLLLNLADVLKAILDAAIQVEIFFRINIVSLHLFSFPSCRSLLAVEFSQHRRLCPIPRASRSFSTVFF
jgi:ABC-type bacteriocin/lantibiotic exporter with double-glycine peptidase domain